MRPARRPSLTFPQSALCQSLHHMPVAPLTAVCSCRAKAVQDRAKQAEEEEEGQEEDGESGGEGPRDEEAASCGIAEDAGCVLQ